MTLTCIRIGTFVLLFVDYLEFDIFYFNRHFSPDLVYIKFIHFWRIEYIDQLFSRDRRTWLQSRHLWQVRCTFVNVIRFGIFPPFLQYIGYDSIVFPLFSPVLVFSISARALPLFARTCTEILLSSFSFINFSTRVRSTLFVSGTVSWRSTYLRGLSQLFDWRIYLPSPVRRGSRIRRIWNRQ